LNGATLQLQRLLAEHEIKQPISFHFYNYNQFRFCVCKAPRYPASLTLQTIYPRADGRIILELDLQVQDGKFWIGFIWLRIETNREILWTL